MNIEIEDISSFPPHIQAQLRKGISGAGPLDPGKKSKANKFRNQPVESAGIKFQSRKEHQRFEFLLLRQTIGEIKKLRLQVDFTLQEAYTDCNGKRVRAIRYKADFAYEENDKLVVEDTKSKVTKTSTYMVKKKMMKEKYDIDIIEI